MQEGNFMAYKLQGDRWDDHSYSFWSSDLLFQFINYVLYNRVGLDEIFSFMWSHITFGIQMPWPWSRPLLYLLYKFRLKRQTQPRQTEFQQVWTGVVLLIFMNVCQFTVVEDHGHNGYEEKRSRNKCLYKADLWKKPSIAELFCTIPLNVLACGLTRLERTTNLNAELPSLLVTA